MTSLIGGNPQHGKSYYLSGRIPAWKKVEKHYNLKKTEFSMSITSYFLAIIIHQVFIQASDLWWPL